VPQPTTGPSGRLSSAAPQKSEPFQTYFDVHRYTMLTGGGHGPRRVAATLAELAVGNVTGSTSRSE
jgi:hypothetical protein